MIYVVDASVAVKWFIDEEGHDDALKLMTSGAEFIAPDIILAEVANVMRRKVRSGHISAIQAKEAVKALKESLKRFVETSHLIEGAVDLSAELDHSVYDCLYLECARQQDRAHVVTADAKFATKVEANYPNLVAQLTDVPMALAFSKEHLARLLTLFERSNATMENVSKLVRRPFGDTSGIISAGDMMPAFDSPNFVRLLREIAALTPHQAATLIATAWYGRGYDSRTFEENYQSAGHLAADPVAHGPYIIGLVQHLENGVARLRLERPGLEASQENDNG